MRNIFLNHIIRAACLLALLAHDSANASDEFAPVQFITEKARFAVTVSGIATTSGMITEPDGSGPLTFCLTDEARKRFGEFLSENAGAKARVKIYGMPEGTTKLPSEPGKGCYVFGHFEYKEMEHVKRVLRGEEPPRLGEAVAAPAPVPTYCPSDDFVQICLKGTRAPENLKRWADTNGWRFQRTDAAPDSYTLLFAKSGHDPFFATVSQIGNATIIECRNTSLPDKANDNVYAGTVPPERTQCDAQAAQLPDAIEQTPVQNPYNPNTVKDSGRIYEWTLSDGGTRDYILTTSLKAGQNHTYWLKRVIIGMSQ